MWYERTPEAIFTSLMEIDPTLQDNKETVMKAIEKLLAEKPDTQFDAVFAANLRWEIEKELQTSSDGITVSKVDWPSLFSKIGLFLKSRSFRTGGGFVVAAFAIFAGWYMYDLRTGIPDVLAGNWDFSYRKIPYDVPSIDLTFSRELDAATVNTANIHLYPSVAGTPVLEKGNVISFKLSEKLKIGQRYMLEISPAVSSKYGIKMTKSRQFEFEAIAGAKATRILPGGVTEDLSKNILVFFNIPMVPLSSWDNKDTLPCPIEIQPVLEGKCRWTTSSVLEFIPASGFSASTKYVVKTKNTQGLLYPLWEVVESSFETMRLAAMVDTGSTDGSIAKFSPSEGISLAFNADVKKEDLLKNLKVEQDQGNGVTKLFGLDIKTLSGTNNTGRIFRILPVAPDAFDYSTTYKITLSWALSSAHGNLPIGKETTWTATSNGFITNAYSYYAEYSESGALVDMYDIPSMSSIDVSNGTQGVAQKNGVVLIDFDQEIQVVPGSVAFVWNGGRSECKLSHPDEEYADENDGNVTKKRPNTRRLRCEIASEIPANTKVNLVVSKSLSTVLKADVVKEFQTAPALAVDTDGVLVSNTEYCVYSTTPLYQDKAVGVVTTPASIIRDIRRDGTEEWNSTTNRYDMKYLCPVRPGKISSIVNVRFNPNTKYILGLKSGLSDIYRGKLSADVSLKEVTSKDIVDKDRYLYNSVSRDLNVIPSDVPLVVLLQSINLSQANIEVCEMDVIGYADYISHGQYGDNYEPKCITKTAKTLTLKNLYWSISPNKFDVEKDILGRPLNSAYVLVRGTALWRYHLGQGGGDDSDREFKSMYVRSNLALTLEKGKNKGYVFASSYDGKEIPSDLTFEGLKFDNGTYSHTPVTNIRFDATKQMYAAGNTDNLAFLVAKSTKYFGVIALGNDQFSNYDFNYVSGQDSMTKDYAYIYTDRPIYRPGDTVHYKGLLRTFNITGYTKSASKNAKLRIYDEGGTLFKEVAIKLDGNANFSGDFAVAKDAKYGRFNFQLFVETPAAKPESADGKLMALGAPNGMNETYIYNDGHFFVEAYSKPTFRAGVGIDKKDAAFGDSVKIQTSPTYYFGGKLANTNFDYSVATQGYFFDAKEFSEYQFGIGYARFECLYWGSCSYGDSVVKVSQGTIGANGNGEFGFTFPSTPDAGNEDVNNERIYTFNVDVHDPDTGKTVSDSVSTVVHVTDGYVGIKTPYWIGKNSDITVNGVTLGLDAKPLSKSKVAIEIIKKEWKNVKKQGVDGVFYNDYSLEKKTEKQESVTTDGNGLFSYAYRPAWDGEYEIRASYAGKNGKSFVSSSSVFISTDSYVAWNDGNNSVTDLVAEKTLMKIGETAVYTLKSPVKSGKYFVTIEKDDGILDAFVKDITSYGERIEIPIKETYLPNIYVKVFLVGKDDGMILPVYKRALSVAKVMTEHKKLSIEVKTDKQNYLPGDKVSLVVFVKDTSGNPVANANGSLSIVDESVLALKGNPKKNPFAFFYDMKRYLGVETYSSLAHLIDKLEVKNIWNGEKWGAGEWQKWGDAKKKRWVFKDTAYWKSDFTTDAAGKFSVTTDALPDNLTTWVAEALVSVTADNRIGVGETSFATTKTVVIQENLPRFLSSLDRMVIGPVVFNKTGKDQDFVVTLSGSHVNFDTSKRTVFLKAWESRAVDFEISAEAYPSSLTQAFFATLDIKVQAKESGDMDEVERTLPIQDGYISEVTATVGQTKNVSFDERLNLAGTDKLSGVLSIHYGATPLPFLTDALSYFNQYPYGCVEQRTSSIVGNIAMKKLYDAAHLPFDLATKKVLTYIDSEQGYKEKSLVDAFSDYSMALPQFQKDNGGFGYWKDSKTSEFGLTAYALQTLSDLKSLKFSSDPRMETSAIAYLKRAYATNHREGCESHDPKACEYTDTERLAAISALLSIAPNDNDAIKLWNAFKAQNETTETRIAKLEVIAKLLASSAVTAPVKESLTKDATDTVTKILSERLVFNPRGAFISNETPISEVKSTARFIEAIALLPKSIALPDDALSGMLRFLAGSKKSDGSFGSTQDTATVIRSLATFLERRSDIAKTKMIASIAINGEAKTDQVIDPENIFSSYTREVSTKELRDDSSVNLLKTGDGTLFYDLTLKTKIPAAKAEARDEGIFVETTYYDYAEYGKIKAAKDQEWANYMSGSILRYEDLKYVRPAAEYLKPVTKFKVGQLVYVRNRILTSESRKRLAFESFIPAGSEIVNTRLSTEKKVDREELFFDREEFRDDRYFGYSDWVDAGEYIGSYVIRMTQAGTFSILPGQAYEFDAPEVFGRTAGKEIEVQD